MEIAKEGDILKAEFEPESLHEAHLSNVLASDRDVYHNTYHILKKLAAAVKPGGVIVVNNTWPGLGWERNFQEDIRQVGTDLGLKPRPVTDRQEAIDLAGDLFGNVQLDNKKFIMKLVKPKARQKSR